MVGFLFRFPFTTPKVPTLQGTSHPLSEFQVLQGVQLAFEDLPGGAWFQRPASGATCPR